MFDEIDYIEEDLFAYDTECPEESTSEQDAEYLSDEYCLLKCKFYRFCYANHEMCIKKIFEDTLQTLTPREANVIKKRYGWNEPQEYTLEEVAKDFNISPERIRQIEVKALRKLRHPTRLSKLEPYLFNAYSESNDNHYSRLLKIIIDDINPQSQFDIRHGIDSSIVDIERNSSKSITEIKNELNSMVEHIDCLKPYYKQLQKAGITTLDHLLHMSSKKIISSAFEMDDVLYFGLLRDLKSAGYYIKDNPDGSTMDSEFVSKLKTTCINNTIYESTLEDLPLGTVRLLFDKGILNVRALLMEIKEIMKDETIEEQTKDHLIDFLKSKHLIVNLDNTEHIVSVAFWDSYFRALVRWMRDNSCSIYCLIKDLEELDCRYSNSTMTEIQTRYPSFKFKRPLIDLCVDISDIDLSVRAFNCLKRSGIDTIGDIISHTYEDLLSVRNLGKSGANEIVEKIHMYGLELGEKKH